MIFNLLILLEDDTFKECGRSDNGGSIYVYNTGANFVIVNSESFKSHATSNGLFLYTYIENTLKYNFVLYSTISESYYSSGKPYGTIRLEYGQIRVISTNSSDNIAYGDSSFHLRAYDNSESSNSLKYCTEDSYMHYCYMMNGYANYGCCIAFWYNKQLFEENNVINNSQTSSTYSGTLANAYDSPYPITIINKCCLIKNNAIGNGIYLFCVYGGIMEVRECTIQNGYSISGSVTTSYSNTVAQNECAAISNCGANIDNIEQCKCKCSVYDNMLINNLQRLFANKPFLI
jgi:hypothetical protein